MMKSNCSKRDWWRCRMYSTISITIGLSVLVRLIIPATEIPGFISMYMVRSVIWPIVLTFITIIIRPRTDVLMWERNTRLIRITDTGNEVLGMTCIIVRTESVPIKRSIFIRMIRPIRSAIAWPHRWMRTVFIR